MALDGIFLNSLVDELKKLLINGKVEKVNQPEKDEIILSIKNNRTVYKLSVSVSSSYPKVNITSKNKNNPLVPPLFCMVLRKYLNNAKLIGISQLGLDRILFIDFESSDEMGFNSIYTLVIEIMGRHSNITLVRQRDQVVMDSIKHLTPDMNSVRTLLPNIKFALPPSSLKLNPFDFEEKAAKDYVTENKIEFNNSFFTKVFTGVGVNFSKELIHRVGALGIDFNLNSITSIFTIAKEAFDCLKSGNFNFLMYYNENSIIDFYCTNMNSLENFSKTLYESPSKLLEDFYFEKDKIDRLHSKSSDLIKLITVNIERCNKKLHLLNETLTSCTEKDTYRIYGELLTSYIYNIKENSGEIEVLNYYSDKEEYIKIKLDKAKSPSENIQYYFKKYNKLKKAEEAAKIQIKSTEEEALYLNSVLTNIKNAESYIEIEEIKKELIETGYIKFKKSTGKKEKLSKPLHFISSDGIDIYVGKNNIQNDYLTLKFADKHDLWLHTKNIPGSHVIVKKFGEIPDKTLEEAALLAAYYSKAKDSSKVPVDYTEIKNVNKPSGSKPGMVIYYTNKTVYITPYKPDIKQVK